MNAIHPPEHPELYHCVNCKQRLLDHTDDTGRCLFNPATQWKSWFFNHTWDMLKHDPVSRGLYLSS